MATGFRLARVLRLRQQLRCLVQDEVAQLGARLAVVRAETAAARQARDGARATAGVTACAGTTGEELRQWEAWEHGLARREVALAQEGVQVAEAIVRGREELLARRREERKLDRLRERAQARAQAEELRQEALLLDDLALRQRTEGEGR